MRILIVEDEVKVRRGMANLISNHTKHTVVGEAKNGMEGLEMALLYQPDLVITDIRMPMMGGLELIQSLREKGFTRHCVILSGYSEFEYAKQAIRYGVDDYLIKPLAPEDIAALLDTVEKKISRELMHQQMTPERLLKDFILEEAEEPLPADELALLCGFVLGKPLCIAGAYMGAAGPDGRKACLERFERIKKAHGGQPFYYFMIENTSEFICITQDEIWEEVQAVVEQKLLSHGLHRYDWVWVKQNVLTFSQMREGYRKLQSCYPYGMVFGCGRMLLEDEIASFDAAECQYPGVVELQLRNAVYGGKKDALERAGDSFKEEMAKQRIRPDAVKESYLRVINFLMELSKEHSLRIYEQLQKMNLMKQAGLAVTRGELENMLGEAVRLLAAGMNQKEDISNYTIKRAIDHIRNHYCESISLEAVAVSLDITPEYLSTLFNREVGINFSTFLKKFRISHAKRLLKGTDKRIYEIAQEVGYPDAKYFNRVFKEEEGLSPGDFRALNG